MPNRKRRNKNDSIRRLGLEEREEQDARRVLETYTHKGRVLKPSFKAFKKRVARIRHELERTRLGLDRLATELNESPALVERVAKTLDVRLRTPAGGKRAQSPWLDRFNERALSMAPFTSIQDIAKRHGQEKMDVVNLNKKKGIRGRKGSHPHHGRFWHASYRKLRIIAFLEKYSSLPDADKSTLAGFESSYVASAKNKGHYQKMIDFVSRREEFKTFVEKVEKKQKMGFDLEDALYEVEADSWHAQRQVFKHLLARANKYEPENLPPSDRRRMKSRLMTLSHNEKIRIPRTIREKWGIEDKDIKRKSPHLP